MFKRFLEQYSYSSETYDDSLWIRSTELDGRDLKIGVTLHFDDTEDNYLEKKEEWQITCYGVRNHLVSFGAYYDTFEFVDESSDHVLKWEHVLPKCSVSFKGKTESPSAVIGRLYCAHVKLLEKWVRFDKYLNMFERLEILIGGGFGLLAEAPLPIAMAYQKVLIECGFDASVSKGYTPRYWDGSKITDEVCPLGVAIFGNGFVVTEVFEADRV